MSTSEGQYVQCLILILSDEIFIRTIQAVYDTEETPRIKMLSNLITLVVDFIKNVQQMPLIKKFKN